MAPVRTTAESLERAAASRGAEARVPPTPVARADLLALARRAGRWWLHLAQLRAAVAWLQLRVRRPAVLRALSGMGSGAWQTLVHLYFGRLVCRRPRRCARPGPPIVVEGHEPPPGSAWVAACLPSSYAGGVAQRCCERLGAALITKPSWAARVHARHRVSGVVAFRAQIRALRAGGRVVLPLLIDDTGDAALTFLGRPARAVSAPVRLAALAGVPVHAVTLTLAQGAVRIRMGPPRMALRGASAAPTIAALAADVQAQVRAWPPLWSRTLYFLRRHPEPGGGAHAADGA